MRLTINKGLTTNAIIAYSPMHGNTAFAVFVLLDFS
jgi:hypothetical protein